MAPQADCDIVLALRARALVASPDDARYLRAAADEVERLRDELRRLTAPDDPRRDAYLPAIVT